MQAFAELSQQRKLSHLQGFGPRVVHMLGRFMPAVSSPALIDVAEVIEKRDVWHRGRRHYSRRHTFGDIR